MFVYKQSRVTFINTLQKLYKTALILLYFLNIKSKTQSDCFEKYTNFLKGKFYDDKIIQQITVICYLYVPSLVYLHVIVKVKNNSIYVNKHPKILNYVIC